MKVPLAVAALLAAITHGHEIEKRQTSDDSKKVVCYYTNWSVYRKGLAKYTPQNINPYLCTHLVYAFGGLTDDFEVGPFDSYQDIEQGGYAKFNGLKQYNKGLKTLLAIGGWNEGSGRFSELVSLPEYRKTFILSAIRHLRRYNFDGLDLDWEYPASRDGSAPEDKENYALLVTELREAFEEEGRKVSKGHLLLTMAVPAGQNYIDKGYDIPSLTRDLDFFNILNYDYHSSYEPTINHHAALMPPPGSSEYEWNAQLNVDWTVKYYIKLGADKHKLVIGIPTYGRSYTLLDGNFTDFGATADGPGEQGKYTRENGFMAFYEVCENIASNGWEVKKPYPRRIGPYAFSGNQWVGYDDEKIVARKAEYVREHDLGGIMYWSLDNDDFRGICNGEEYPLVEAGKKALFAGLDSSINEARNQQQQQISTSSSSSSSSSDNTNTVDSRTSPRGSSLIRGSTSSNTRTQDAFSTRNRESSRTRTQLPPQRRNKEVLSRAREDFSESSRVVDQESSRQTPSHPSRSGSRGGTRFRDSVSPSSSGDATTTQNQQENRFRESTSTRRPVGLSSRFKNRRPSQDRAAATTTTTSTTTTTTTQRTTQRTTPPSRRPGGRRRPGNQRQQQQSTTINPLNTPPPPTTPSPVSNFACKREGFYPNPDNCHKYYWCLDSGASGLGIVAHAFTCPSGLVFSKTIDGCDHPTRTKCSTEDKKSRGGGAKHTTPGPSTPIPTTTEISTDYSYYDDYYYYDYDTPEAGSPAPEEDSNSVNRGSKSQNSGGNQFVSLSEAEVSQTPDIVEESSSSNLGGRTRPQYSSISRDRSRAQAQESPVEEAAAPRQQQQQEREPSRSLSRPEYTSIQRQRPAAQAPFVEEEDPATAAASAAAARQSQGGDRVYVTFERQRPSTSVREPAFPLATTESTLEYVTINRVRPTTTPSSVFSSDSRSRESAPQGLDDRRTTPRYVTLERNRPSTTQETLAFTEETSPITTESPTEQTTTGLVRIRTPTSSSPRPTVPSAFRRPRPVSDDVTAQPETDSPSIRLQPDNRRPRPQLESRPRPQLESRPRPQFESRPRLQQPQTPEVQDEENPSVEPDSRISKPLIVPRPRPTTILPPVTIEEETVSPTEDELFIDTTVTPETTEKVSIKPFTPRPRPISPPRPDLSTTTPRPRPTTPQPEERTSKPRPSPQPRPPVTTPRPTTTRPPARSPRPSRPPVVTRPSPQAPQSPVPSSILSNDYYDYYYEDLDGALTGTLGQLATLSDKAVLMADGTVTCYDTGYFAHPDSCKKFISCSKTVRGLVRGWVYTCPEQLVFDPVGGMCNWAEAVDCAGGTE